VVKTIAYSFVDLFKQAVGLAPLYVPAFAKPGDEGILTFPGALENAYSIIPADSGYQNKINASCVFEFSFYKPKAKATKITCPLLYVVAHTDLLCPPHNALATIKLVEKGEIVRTAGDHFDLYPGASDFEDVVKAELEFLGRHVPL